jgi:hypothetical protein
MGEGMRSIKYGYYFLTAIVLAAFSPLASSAPAVCGQTSHNGYSGEFDDRFYQVVEDSGISWDEAKAAAEALQHDGVLGRLATINSFAEDEYVHCLIQATSGATGEEAWIGGFQATGSNEPGDGWQWLNGELIDPDNTTGSNYTNWQSGEPDDDTTPNGNERHLGASLGGIFGWNDEDKLNNIGSYVVEFGDALAPIPAINFAFGGGGFPLGQGGPRITYPQQAVVSGDVEVRVWRFIGDPQKCGLEQWDLGELVPGDGPVIIPPYLCATPTISNPFAEIVVRRSESLVQVPTGVVQITGTSNYGTANPVFPNDPTNQDVVVYRHNIDDDQLEKADETGVNALFLGNVAETTNGVINPPRGAGGAGSYFIENLRVHCDVPFGYVYEEVTDSINTCVVALQGYKLGKGLAAVIAAKPALSPTAWAALKEAAEAALRNHNRGNYVLALDKVKLVLKQNDRSKYTIIEGTNPYAEVAYRYLNARDIYERRLIPYN